MICTTFWHPDGAPMSAQQFLEMLFGRLPEFFKDEAELRTIWSAPDTRKKLLQGLAEKGFGPAQLAEMQKIIDAEKSDIFDVLAYVAYALPPLTRQERAARAKVIIDARFNSKQRVFLDFVLSHYVNVGVSELDQEKLTPLLHLKYHDSINDAVADLGPPEDIRTDVQRLPEVPVSATGRRLNNRLFPVLDGLTSELSPGDFVLPPLPTPAEACGYR